MPEFEWDDAKAAANAAKHELTSEEATLVFLAPDRRDVPSRHVADPEQRLIAFGTVEGLLLAVVYTVAGKNIRIISARRANRTERRHHGELPA